SSRRRHTRSYGDWSSDVCSSDLTTSRASPRCWPRSRPTARRQPTRPTRTPPRHALRRTWTYPDPATASTSTDRGCLTSTTAGTRSEEHTSELQSPYDLVCRLLLE